mmetsp:Transcript_73/g.216  ORF Transcript_73/g.216 Transcript_73/m.216 type:complete len:380 (-) Transcript_73:9-1148(-)
MLVGMRVCSRRVSSLRACATTASVSSKVAAPTQQPRKRKQHGPLQKQIPVTPNALAQFIKYRRDLFVNMPRPVELDADAKAMGVEVTPAYVSRLAAIQCDVLASEHVGVQPDETLDVIFRHRVLLLQSRKGYRTTSDAMLLTCRAAELWNEVHGDDASPNIVVDVCAGSGVVGIGLGLRYAKSDVLALELQSQFAERCHRNAILNGLAKRMEVVNGNASEVDLSHHLGSVDLLVCNPPYMQVDDYSTRDPQSEERALAKRETAATIDDFLRLTKSLLHPTRGIALFVYPQKRRDRMNDALDRVGGFHSIRWTDVHRGGISYHKPSATVIVAVSVGDILAKAAPDVCTDRLMHPVGSEDVTKYTPWIEDFFSSIGLHVSP